MSILGKITVEIEVGQGSAVEKYQYVQLIDLNPQNLLNVVLQCVTVL